MARTFPRAEVRGDDISQPTLGRAEGRGAAEGAVNASFPDPRRSPLPDDHSADLVCTFDCLHDMTDPAGMAAAIRGALSDDGAWLLVDIKAHESFAENAEKNPMASMMYGISVLSCLSSALSEPGGASRGTLGLTPATAESLDRKSTRLNSSH